MLKKRKTRELAMQTLFLWDAAGAQDDDVARQVISDGVAEFVAVTLERTGEPPDADDVAEIRSRSLAMATGTWDQRPTIDPWIERLAPQWPTKRQPAVDRNLIRLAVWELTNTDTPPKVVIDEAIELAKQFSTENSPAFVNGVLDSVLKEKRALSGETGALSSSSTTTPAPDHQQPAADH